MLTAGVSPEPRPSSVSASVSVPSPELSAGSEAAGKCLDDEALPPALSALALGGAAASAERPCPQGADARPEAGTTGEFGVHRSHRWSNACYLY